MLDFQNLPAKDKLYYAEDGIAIYCADCRDILPLILDKCIDLVLTDPPYPDYNTFEAVDIAFLCNIESRQLIFWSAKLKFPLDYTSIHIWDKQVATSEYERIFERNGQLKYKMFRAHVMDSVMSANYNHDVYWKHPTQKPRKLLDALLNYTKAQFILDPFLGSGTTAYCAKKLGRKCIGIEISEKYCEIARNRLRQSVMKL